MNINKLTRNAVFATVAAGGLYAASAIKTPKNDVSADIKKTEAPANPVQTPVIAAFFPLGLFGRKKAKKEQEQKEFWENVLQAMKEQALKPAPTEEEKLEADKKAAEEAGIPLEKYQSFFKETPKSKFRLLHRFGDGYFYYNTARQWLYQLNDNYKFEPANIKEGFAIMNNCFEQYEKEGVKVFEEEDKAMCKKLMKEVEESIDKGGEIDPQKLAEIIVLYDKKRLYPYI